MNTDLIWLFSFLIYIALMLFIDLKILSKRKTMSVGNALKWSVFWIAQAMIFAVLVYFFRGHKPALEFVTAYVVEESLSVDNLFVFILIFQYFKVEPKYQHRILFWGIIGAMVMRGIFILAGVALVNRFSWLLIVFGVILVVSGIKLLFKKDEEIDPEKNPVIKLFRKYFRVTNKLDGNKFFIKENGKKFATTLFVVLLMIETTDLIFAVDSIPAVMGISRDTLIIYTSNIFAILGLRALYFALNGIMQLFHYLSYGLSIVLCFIGVKMIIEHYYPISIGVSLGVVGSVLIGSVLLSLIFPKK